MKKLIFVRHAKAEPEEEIPGLSDFERSLTPGGKKVSKYMAQQFLKKDTSPGLMITSPAFRALETAFIFAEETGVSYDDVRLESRLYFNTNLEKLLEILSEISEDVNTVSLFGHNPSFTDMPDKLSAEGCESVPKAGVVCITFNTDKWSEIKKRSGKIEYFLKPPR
ncbi:MAG TPA: histidine phosphatase family protein [Bacteroidales bacterium]|nr:histidine phosphatase family protein [Bacteroidales bacterium]